MNDEVKRGRLVFLALSALLIVAIVIDTSRAVAWGGVEEAGPFVLGLISAIVLLYGTYRGSTAARRLTVALLLFAAITDFLIAFIDVEQEGIQIDFGLSPDLWVLALGALALAAAVVLVTSRPVRSFLNLQRAALPDATADPDRHVD